MEYVPPASHFLQVGDLVLDCNMYQVHVGRSSPRIINLTPMEFKLLHYLMRSPGKVFSGDHLLVAVWEYPEDVGNPDVVRMYVKRLRDKIEPDPRQPIYIHTIPGHGYTIPASVEAPPQTGFPAGNDGREPIAVATSPSVDEVLAAVLETTASCRAILESVLAGLGRRPNGSASLEEQPAPPTSGHSHASPVPPAAVLAAAQSLALVVAELGLVFGSEPAMHHGEHSLPHPTQPGLSSPGAHPW